MKYFALLLATGSALFAEQFVTGQAARLVIGQETFTRQTPGISSGRLGAVSGIAYANDTLFVVDSSRVQATPQHNRVLIYQNISSKFPGPKDPIQYDNQRCPVCGGFADVVLGQPDFSEGEIGAGNDGLRTPTAIATDGRVLAVADTDNNRILLWNSIPTTNGQPPDVVIGQPDFTSVRVNFGQGVNERGLRGPQGLWIQDGRLYVADTQNHRVLIWNRIPTENGAPADVVLGQPNFTAFVQDDLTQAAVSATPSNLLNPVSVTSDGTKLFVTDLGHNRVLIWNSIPTQNAHPADVVVGQPDVTTTDQLNAHFANNVTALCSPTGEQDSQGNDIYPPLCAATLNFPRYALSDGERLFIADGGNDRILVFNSIPNQNGQPADAVLGQLADTLAQDSEPLRISSADSVRTPMALAWDGSNLYVTDPFNRRVMVWSPGDQPLPLTGVRNAASQDIFAVGTITFTSDPNTSDEVTVTIGEAEYKYTAREDDEIPQVITGLVEAINAGAGDPLVFASPNIVFNQILLTSRQSGDAGNSVSYSLAFSAGAQITGQGSGTLAGGQDAAKIAPGTLVMLIGENLADETAVAPEEASSLPTRLGGVEVYFDGIPAPLLYVSPTQINAQMPWEVSDSYSVNAWVRITGSDGRTRTTTAIAVPVIPQNPGIFAEPGSDPRSALAFHGSSFATGVVSVDGSVTANNVATVIIEDREYSYTVQEGDTLAIIRDRLIERINAGEERVTAVPASIYTRIVLQAREQGEAGSGISYNVRVNDGATVILTPLSPALCCASEEGARVTEENPALPGELIRIYATGLGFVQPDEAKHAVVTGMKYDGPAENSPTSPIDAIAGGRTANVLYAGLVPGMLGVYELRLQLNSDIPTNPQTQLTIAQDIYVSNIVTFAVVNPNPPEEGQ